MKRTSALVKISHTRQLQNFFQSSKIKPVGANMSSSPPASPPDPTSPTAAADHHQDPQMHAPASPPTMDQNAPQYRHNQEEPERPPTPSSPQPLARLQGTNHKSLLIHKVSTILGRDAEQCDIILPSRSVSSRHALLEYNEKKHQWHLTDLNSLNGTFVNHHRLSNEKLLLKHGDSIRFGYDQISYVLYVLTQRELRRPFEKPVLNQKTQPEENQVKKLQNERQSMKESIQEMKRQKKDSSLGTLTFQGAEGMVTVPIGEWDENENNNAANSESFPVHETRERDMDALSPEAASRRHRGSLGSASSSSVRREDTLNMSNLHNIESRLSTLEQNFHTDASQQQQLFNEEQDHFLDQVQKLTRDIIERIREQGGSDHLDESPTARASKNPNSARRSHAGEAQDSPLDAQEDSSLFNTRRADIQKQQRAILKNLSTISQYTNNQLKQNQAASNMLSDQEGGIKRYATAVYNELQRTKAKLHAQQSHLNALKMDRGAGSSKQSASMDALTSQLELKNAEIAHLREQLTQRATSMYSDRNSQQRIRDICTSQFEELELARKEIYEWRQRHRLRALEWDATMEERSRLEARVRELQHALHRQMSEVHTLMMHKEQRLITYKSKVTDLAAGIGTQNGTKEQQINRKKAADFLFDEITRCERENSNAQVQVNQLSHQLHQSQLQNNELKLEINHLRDALQYTDAQHVQERVRALQDKLKDLQTECSVNRVIELQEDVSQLRQRLSQSDRRCKELQKTLGRVEVPIEDSCIAFLERKIRKLEDSLRGKKQGKSAFPTAQKKAMERANIQRLEKHNQRLNKLLVEREYEQNHPKPPSDANFQNEDNNRGAGPRVNAKFMAGHLPSQFDDDALIHPTVSRADEDSNASEQAFEVSSIHEDDDDEEEENEASPPTGGEKEEDYLGEEEDLKESSSADEEDEADDQEENNSEGADEERVEDAQPDEDNEPKDQEQDTNEDEGE